MFEYCGNAVIFFTISGFIILSIFAPLYGLPIALIIMAVILIPFFVFYRCICCFKSSQSQRTENTDSVPESQLETRIQEIYSTTTPTGFENISRTLRPENYQRNLSRPPEIILTPSSPQIINSECDRPPSYESLYHQWNKQ